MPSGFAPTDFGTLAGLCRTHASLPGRPQFTALPLHRQVIPWASRGNIAVIHRADNFVTPYWVKMQ